MPASCPICARPDSAALLAELPTQSLRVLAARYHISRSVLGRHRRHGCPAARVLGEIAPSGADLARIAALLTDIKALLQVLVQHRGRDDEYTGTVAPAIPWNRL